MTAQVLDNEPTFLQIPYQYDRRLDAGVHNSTKAKNIPLASDHDTVGAGQIRFHLTRWEETESNWIALPLYNTITEVHEYYYGHKVLGRHNTSSAYVESRADAYFAITLEHYNKDGTRLDRFLNNADLEVPIYFDGNASPAVQHIVPVWIDQTTISYTGAGNFTVPYAWLNGPPCDPDASDDPLETVRNMASIRVVVRIPRQKNQNMEQMQWYGMPIPHPKLAHCVNFPQNTPYGYPAMRIPEEGEDVAEAIFYYASKEVLVSEGIIPHELPPPINPLPSFDYPIIPDNILEILGGLTENQIFGLSDASQSFLARWDETVPRVTNYEGDLVTHSLPPADEPLRQPCLPIPAIHVSQYATPPPGHPLQTSPQASATEQAGIMDNVVTVQTDSASVPEPSTIDPPIIPDLLISSNLAQAARIGSTAHASEAHWSSQFYLPQLDDLHPALFFLTPGPSPLVYESGLSSSSSSCPSTTDIRQVTLLHTYGSVLTRYKLSSRPLAQYYPVTDSFQHLSYPDLSQPEASCSYTTASATQYFYSTPPSADSPIRAKGKRKRSASNDDEVFVKAGKARKMSTEIDPSVVESDDDECISSQDIDEESQEYLVPDEFRKNYEPFARTFLDKFGLEFPEAVDCLLQLSFMDEISFATSLKNYRRFDEPVRRLLDTLGPHATRTMLRTLIGSERLGELESVGKFAVSDNFRRRYQASARAFVTTSAPAIPERNVKAVEEILMDFGFADKSSFRRYLKKSRSLKAFEKALGKVVGGLLTTTLVKALPIGSRTNSCYIAL